MADKKTTPKATKKAVAKKRTVKKTAASKAKVRKEKPLFRERKYGPIIVHDYGPMLLYEIKCIDENGEIVEERTIDKGSYIFKAAWENSAQDDQGKSVPFWYQTERGIVDGLGRTWLINPKGK